MQETFSRWTPRSLRYVFACFGALLLLTIGGWNGFAQSTQGTIFGSVKDASGAVVSGAAVTLTNTDEGVSRVTKTNGSGEYSFSDAKASHYMLPGLCLRCVSSFVWTPPYRWVQ